MSCVYYTTFGIKLPFSSIKNRDDLEEYHDDPCCNAYVEDEPCIVTEGLNGVYVFIGMIISKNMEDEGFEHTELPIDKKYEKKFYEIIKTFCCKNNIEFIEPKYHVFAHYH